MPAAIAKRVFDPYEALALAKFSAGAYREEAAEGPHQVNFCVRVKGELTIGCDREQLYTPAPSDVYRLLAVALRRLKGVTLLDLAAEALGELGEPADAIDTEPLKAALCEHLTAKRGKQKRKGDVKGAIEFARLAR